MNTFVLGSSMACAAMMAMFAIASRFTGSDTPDEDEANWWANLTLRELLAIQLIAVTFLYGLFLMGFGAALP